MRKTERKGKESKGEMEGRRKRGREDRKESGAGGK